MTRDRIPTFDGQAAAALEQCPVEHDVPCEASTGAQPQDCRRAATVPILQTTTKELASSAVALEPLDDARAGDKETSWPTRTQPTTNEDAPTTGLRRTGQPSNAALRSST
jgi:hypothetical protein